MLSTGRSEVFHERYAWLQQQVKDQENDVTSDYESTDLTVDDEALKHAAYEMKCNLEHTHPIAYANSLKLKNELGRTGYVLVRAYGAKSQIAIIRDIDTPKYSNVLDTQTYDAFIIDGINDTENVFPNVELDAISAITKSKAALIPELGKIIWRYARETICTVTLNVGDCAIWTAPIYEFPFSDFPSDPIPGMSLLHHQMRLEFNPPLKEFAVNRRVIMIKNGPCYELFGRYYIPGYDAIVDGMWCNWRAMGRTI